MADQKISQLTDGTSFQAGDEAVVNRSGTNYKVDPTQFGSSIDVTGTVTAEGLTVSNAGANADITLTEGSTNTDARIRNSNGILQIGADINDEFGASEIQLSVDGKEFLTVDRFGDISFYEDTGTTPKFFWDASAEALGINVTDPIYTLEVQGEAGIELYNASGGGNVLNFRPSLGDASKYNMSISSYDHSGGGVGPADGLSINGFDGVSIATGSSTTRQERLRIDSDGNLLVGKTTTTRTDVGAVFGPTVNRITLDGLEALELIRNTSDGDILHFFKENTQVGSIGSNGGTNLYLTSGGRGLRFNDNDFSPITNANVYSDNTTDLGRSTARFDDIYATNGTIQTSDRNEKENIRKLLEAEARVAQAAKGLLRAFQWKDSVAEKGDDARIHFGIIAQDLEAAFEAEGLDAGRYAMFIHSTWADEETGEERSRMGVRYSELLAFIIAAL